MKATVKLKMISLFAVALLSSALLVSTSAKGQDLHQNMLQEADRLFLEGHQTANLTLIQQAKDKFTEWLDANKESENKETIARVLRSRANASLTLGELDLAAHDFQESNDYDPIGEVQLGLCLLNKTMAVDSVVLQNCYQKAVQIFTETNSDKTNINFILARILSGDSSAIMDYKNLVAQTEDPDLLDVYRMAAKEYLDESSYKDIFSH